MPSTHSKTSVCILQVTTTGNDVVPVDKEVLQPVVENGDVITQQQSNPNEEFTAAEKQLISIPMVATMLDTDQVRLLGEN